MNKYETITFNLDNYEGNLNELMLDVGGALHILTQNRYECRFYYEDCGIYILEYNHQACKELGNAILKWLTWEEEEALEAIARYKDEDE